MGVDRMFLDVPKYLGIYIAFNSLPLLKKKKNTVVKILEATFAQPYLTQEKLECNNFFAL